MSKVKYSKVETSPSDKNYVTFYQNSNYINFSFSVHFDEKGNVDWLSSMKKDESKDGSIYVSNFDDGNITEKEFNEALLKTLDFVTKRNYAICVTTNLREPK